MYFYALRGYNTALEQESGEKPPDAFSYNNCHMFTQVFRHILQEYLVSVTRTTS